MYCVNFLGHILLDERTDDGEYYKVDVYAFFVCTKKKWFLDQLCYKNVKMLKIWQYFIL